MKSFRLNPTKIKYSRGEQKVFSLLTTKKRDSNLITKLFYNNNDGVKFSPKDRNIVLGTLKGLQRKVLRNNELFRIKRTKQSGPYPIEFWLEEK